ncbi:class II aldolase [Xylocopilactobacillus apicola]|uniref:Fructose-bisphosphate aldolase n=1 Tax=Xylocopilactobacillus apicola TaxID=2932184 RepID=A0AAU9DL52_9LACO|nr:class II aldolase [Xylocopilactobacillus apicola]BDR57597.1 fructose-bisphosphate aldolase [Xylocopilactobacillus apicola]
MPLVNGFDLIDIIKEEHVVAGAFNTTNLETTIGILQAVEKSRIPAFIQIAPTNIPVSGYGFIADMVNRYAAEMDTPVALHLDHGKSFDSVRQAARAGFTSVMTDNAKYDYEENVQHTYEAVQFAKGYGIPVEAELGAIAGKEDDIVTEGNSKTDPKQVLDFVERTGVNMLAVAVGNVHGLNLDPNIDFPLLKQIQDICPVPLVLHGASGIPDEQISQMVDNGVIKINVASDLRQAFIQSAGKDYEADPERFDIVNVSLNAEKAVEEVVYHKIQVMNRNSPTPVR